ncbi:Insect cuticle protein [Oryctes borbonicus]|uniref:Insect cuticle protein n=1 Tax=Oryctes borbonicus TaxID=1629725 RepID=A0A0T6BD70_9SCAR|nr:Insect cuticle protein [Oryctes borbonicus]
MKFLIVASVLIGSCIVQGLPQRGNPEQYDVDPAQYKQQRQPPQQPDVQYDRSRESTTFIPILRFEKEQGDGGSYKTAWETGNNIIAQEEGFLKSLGPDPDSPTGEELNAQVQQGSYTYTAPDGQIITVTYTADEKGFQATGDHLPTPPPVSPEVQKGLDLIYAGIRAQEEAVARGEIKEPQQGRRDNLIQQEYNGQYKQQ